MILFLHFHVLPGAFGEKLYICLFWECGCEFLVYIGYFTWEHFFFPDHFKECEYVLLIYWLVHVYFILFWGVNRWCVRVMPRRKQDNYGKRNLMKKMYVRRQARECGSCHIVLDLLISPYSANLLRLHLYRDIGWKTALAFCSPVHGSIRVSSRLA